MASILDFFNGGGQLGGLLGNLRDPSQSQAAPNAPPGSPSFGGGLNNYIDNNRGTLLALAGGLASGGIGGGFSAASQAANQADIQRLALAHLLQQQSQFGQELALKKYLTSPEYLGKTEEQKAAIGQKYQNPIALPPGGSLYKPGVPGGPEGSVVASNDVGLLSQDAVDRLAHQVAAGDMTPLQQQGYGPLGAVNRAKINERVSAIRGEKGISGEEAASKRIEYHAETQAAGATAKREVAVQTPSAEFKKMAPIAIAASEALNRTDFPNLNAITNAVQKGVGGEAVVRAHTALTSLGNIYSRVISPTGQSTDQTRNTAYGLINEALAHGQVKAAVELMDREIDAAASGVKDVQTERLRNFLQKNGVSVPAGPAGAPRSQGAPAETAAPPAAAPAAPAAPKEGDIIFNKAGQRMQLRNNRWMPVGLQEQL